MYVLWLSGSHLVSAVLEAEMGNSGSVTVTHLFGDLALWGVRELRLHYRLLISTADFYFAIVRVGCINKLVTGTGSHLNG